MDRPFRKIWTRSSTGLASEIFICKMSSEYRILKYLSGLFSVKSQRKQTNSANRRYEGISGETVEVSTILCLTVNV